MSGVGGLDADLMFAAGLQPEPQFGDEAFAGGERILRDDFVMRDGLAGFGARVFELCFRKHVLAQFGRPATNATYSRFMECAFNCSMRW